jgi:hypothetical protein
MMPKVVRTRNLAREKIQRVQLVGIPFAQSLE